jgi:hypothetical protein
LKRGEEKEEKLALYVKRVMRGAELLLLQV